MQGGGVLVLKSKEIIVIQLNVKGPKEVEIIADEILPKGGKIIVATIYMPPYTNTWNEDGYRKLAENT